MKNFKKMAYCKFILKVILGCIFLISIPKVSFAQQLMDYFTATPIIGSLSSTCWGAAQVGPRDQSNGLEDKTMEQWTYWDGSIMKAPDGTYHMFAARWSQAIGFNGWMNDSHCVHATSTNLCGPYTDHGLAFTDNNGMGHNVGILKLKDGDPTGKQYAITLSGGVPGSGRVYGANSLDGPWSYLGNVSVASGSSYHTYGNMQIILRPDGKYEAIDSAGIIALSDNLLGPYTDQGPSIYNDISGIPDKGRIEDPTIWYSGGKYHWITNQWDTQKAYHLTSLDGIKNWQLEPGLAYEPRSDFLRYTNGTVNHWFQMERPRPYIENGHVVAFTFASINVKKEDLASLGSAGNGSKVVVVPFDGSSFDGGSPTPVPTPAPTPVPIQDPIFSGGPYTLNGTSDYVDLPDGLTNDLYDFSIACRVNLNSLDTWTRIFDFGNDTNIFMMLTPASGNTGYPYFCITLTGNDGEQGLNGNSTIPIGSWQHIAVTKSGSTGILYINGQEVDRNTNMILNPADMGNTMNNYIGRSQWSHDPYLNGQVDEFYVYNRAISAAEVEALASSQEITPTPIDTPTPTATSTPPPGDCNVSFDPGNSTQALDSSFQIDVVVNSGNQKLAAYGFTISFDASILGVANVEAGADGFLAAANTDTPGEIIASGFDTAGTGPGSDLRVLIITFTALAEGTSPLTLYVDRLIDGATNTIGTACGNEGSVEVVLRGLLGDTNDDRAIDIIDALLTAQHYVGLDPAGFILGNADTNCDGSIDIVDALLIAQFYVGLITSFC